ncbi:unnamed protein product [Brassica oleracea]|uniref:(rape) hypothetical protein n=1 Tax=Brassica napus TaxID=3708 RepID=A0A816J8P0_BRANA|nr:unnamed protein product [Brassica napus]
MWIINTRAIAQLGRAPRLHEKEENNSLTLGPIKVPHFDDIVREITTNNLPKRPSLIGFRIRFLSLNTRLKQQTYLKNKSTLESWYCCLEIKRDVKALILFI